MHEDVIRRHLGHENSASILERVRMAIVGALPSGRVTGEQVVRARNMRRRTLQRRLRGHSTNFRGLLAEVRQEQARSYIRDAHYSVTEVAFSLGYAATSAFSRALRGWFGIAPTEVRQRSRIAC
jgi:AraC-like DNA-binding protein